jgi:hypothetical protein
LREGSTFIQRPLNLLADSNKIQIYLCGVQFTFSVPSNRVISSLEGKFGTVGEPFVLVLEGLFMKILNLCKNDL